MKTTTLIVLLLLTACAPQTPQGTQDNMYSGVWYPQEPSFPSARRGAAAASTGRYYGAKDFFNN